MIPVLYNGTETAFTSHGLGDLPDALSCTVKHEINGEYELSMIYPVTGARYSDIALGCIIKANPDPLTEAQLFRIYRITRPISGRVSVYARHIAYDLSGYAVMPFTASGMQNTLTQLVAHTAPALPFSITTARSGGGDFALTMPRNAWKMLGGEQGSILDAFGGEWYFNNFAIELKTQIGADRGVYVRYGKNLTDIKHDADSSGVYTAICPFWADESTVVTLPETIIGTGRTFVLDASDHFETAPTVEDLRAYASAYLANLGAESITIDISFVMLDKSLEYADLRVLERVTLGDTVHVIHEGLGVNLAKRCNSVVYNVLLDRYDNVTLGSVKQNLADVIVATQKEKGNIISVSTLEKAVKDATAAITGQAGGYVKINSVEGHPYEILIMDTDSEQTATNIWRWNMSGLAFSGDGGATYSTAITSEGTIVADFIAAGSINASRLNIDDVAAGLSGYFSATEEGVLLTVSQQYATQGSVQGVASDLAALDTRIDTHFEFSNDGMKIKGTNGAGDAYVLISADKQTFFQGGEAVLTLENNGITASNVRASGDISAKTWTIDPWQFFVDSNGVLTLGRNS